MFTLHDLILLLMLSRFLRVGMGTILEKLGRSLCAL